MDDLRRLRWPDLVAGGHVQRLTVIDAGMVAIDMSLFYLWEQDAARAVLGADAWERALEKAGDRLGQEHLMLVGVDGPLAALFRPSAMRIVQGGDTLKLVTADVVLLGEPAEGLIEGEFRNAGIMMVDTVVDMDQPFTIVADLRPGLGLFTTEYPGRRAVVAATPEPAPPPPEQPADVPAEPVTPEVVEADSAALAAEVPVDGAAPDELPSAETAAPPAAVQEAPLGLDFGDAEEETVLARTLEQTSWPRVGLLVVLLGLVSAAFVMKLGWLRWGALAATVAILGFGGGGFLSVSHIISGIKVGPSVYLSDLPLLLLVSFTVVTTLLWGRVFCGFLCPFGALQDFLERVVPRRFRRELPKALHERASLVKYGVLVLVLAPALAGSDLIVFHYFEPFGTVFFLSASVLLWTIALAFLTASAVVPRFYCRYVCPLGASLALASLVAPFRIRRVEQCGLCTVCERSCPTGAITADRVDFKECVRCNVCETNLIQKAGVCRHDMDTVRSRLVTLRVSDRRGMADVA
jgi:ferredoxin